jgi:hypothetical protein
MAATGSSGPSSMTDAQFQGWLSSIRDAAAPQDATATAPTPEPASPDQVWSDYGFDDNRPRPRPPFDAKDVLADMGLTHVENELVRKVIADVTAQVAAQHATGQQA